VTAPALHTGVNSVTVLELDAAASTAIRFVPGPDLGHTEE
jgi:hypothetical protein